MSTVIYHNHHIIPKHAGGTDSPDNLVRLTVEEHAKAHRKLYEEYGRWEDKLAYQGLAGFKGKEEIIKELQREGSQKSSGNSGHPHTEESKQKMREAMTGRKLTEETRKKMSEAHKTRPPTTEETKRKIGKANKGNVPWNKGITKIK